MPKLNQSFKQTSNIAAPFQQTICLPLNVNEVLTKLDPSSDDFVGLIRIFLGWEELNSTRIWFLNQPLLIIELLFLSELKERDLVVEFMPQDSCVDYFWSVRAHCHTSILRHFRQFFGGKILQINLVLVKVDVKDEGVLQVLLQRLQVPVTLVLIFELLVATRDSQDIYR